MRKRADNLVFRDFELQFGEEAKVVPWQLFEVDDLPEHEI